MPTGVREGAPNAVQVADRRHLLRNLGDAVQALADKHSAAASRAAHHVRAPLRASGQRSRRLPDRSAKAQPGRTGSVRLRVHADNLEEAARLRAAGESIKRVAAELGAERKT